ncbi:hypothetical protein GCM10017709_33800 [Glutamicibacter nicotianae]
MGLVTIASLLVSGVLTYLALVLLGWGMNYRLSLAGVAGLIVAIGLIADSFIVVTSSACAMSCAKAGRWQAPWISAGSAPSAPFWHPRQ